MRKTNTILGIFAVLTGLTASPVIVSAASPAPSNVVQLQQDQAQLEAVDAEVKSISGRVKVLTDQIAAMTAQRAQAEQQIASLQAESTALLPDLQKLTEAYKQRRSELAKAVLQDYQQSAASEIEVLASSKSFSETLARASYQGAIESYKRDLAGNAQETYDQLHDRKSDLDLKRSSLEVAKRQLDALGAAQAQQQTELNELLANRTNEAAYLAARVAKEKAAQDAILSGTSGPALWGTYADGSTVKKGDIIGFEGSTGNSTGCHLHFSTIVNGQWVNPDGFWGVLTKPEGTRTQDFGMTDYAKGGAYGGDIHNGLDIARPCGAPIKAAADGVIIRDNRTDGSGFGHYIMIRHANGLITLYAHML